MEENKLCMCDGPVSDSNDIDRLRQPEFITTSIVLGLVNVAVVFGNCLVITAVCTTRKLRTVTNIFIVSLAFADLMLGCIILPFSITNQVLKYWIFGRVMCTGWLAVDVWLSTASILNLCAISFDRYIAITRPIQYQKVLSSSRARYLTAGVWISAFSICLPPLLGWRDNEYECPDGENLLNKDSFSSFVNLFDTNFTILLDNITLNDELVGNVSFESKCHRCFCKCTLVDTQGYRIYSALGSFFLPMLVMVFFYIRIYMAAVKTAASLRKGVLTTKNADVMSKQESDMTLRIHTGGNRMARGKPLSNGYAKNNKKLRQGSQTNRRVSSCLHNNSLRTACVSSDSKMSHISSYMTSKYSKEDICVVRQDSDGVPREKTRQDGMDKLSDLKPTKRARLVVKGGKFNIKLHTRKFRRETKAAKTLAIIVGAFILCWLPFFTIYLIGAFREDLSDTLFEVLFWLGYCNSAINPCIYALCARDFREAFKRILCRWCPRKSVQMFKQESGVTKNARILDYPRESESMSDT